MASKGSIIYKILIVLFGLALWQVISIPGKIWSEEDQLREASRENMNSIYEAQMYHYSKTKSFVPTDSLEYLVKFVKNDSSLNVRQRIGKLSHVLVDSISRILEVPTLSAIVPISQSLSEIKNDLEFNTRYFKQDRYVNILNSKNQIAENLSGFDSNSSFPNFIVLKNYVDSLYVLKDRLNEDKLKNSSMNAKRFADSIRVYLPKAELSAFTQFFGERNTEINTFIRDIKATDLTAVTSVADRLKKFIDRINDSVKLIGTLNPTQDAQRVGSLSSAIEAVDRTFNNDTNAAITESSGFLSLSETDSILVKLNDTNFYDPDNFDGEQRYIINYPSDRADLTVESPNLLDKFQSELKAATDPYKDSAMFTKLGALKASMDSVARFMEDTKTEQRLARYSTDLLLGIKEVNAEMQDLSSIKFYRYAGNMKNFVETVQTEKQLSVLKPMIEDILNPIDTLATRMKNRDVKDLETRLNYFNSKITVLDSIMKDNPKIPARVKRNLPSFQEKFQMVYAAMDELKSSFSTSEADAMVASTTRIENALLNTLNGYNEKVHFVFNKKHENHGYIQNGNKSWEVE